MIFSTVMFVLNVLVLAYMAFSNHTQMWWLPTVGALASIGALALKATAPERRR